jgi:transposase-like protein
MARERRLFSEEFKREAVKLVGQPGASKAAISRDLGIGANLLGRWCRDANVDAEVSVGREKVSSLSVQAVALWRIPGAPAPSRRALGTRVPVLVCSSIPLRLYVYPYRETPGYMNVTQRR